MASKTYLDIVLLALGAATVSWLASYLVNPQLLLWDNMNIWFGSDIPRVQKNMTIRTEGHNGSFKHPLFALLVWPPTALTQMVVGDTFSAVRIILAINAACSVSLLVVLAGRIGLGRIDRALVALLFIASSSFMFWYSVPETFAFGATTILLTLFAASYAADGKEKLLPLLIFGIAGLSMTITNFAVFYIALLCGLWVAHAQAGLKTALVRSLKPLCIVLFVCAILAVVQDHLFGDAGLFFNVRALAGESKFMGQTSNAPLAWRPVILVVGSVITGAITMIPSLNKFPTGDVEIMALAMPTYALESGIEGTVHVLAIGLFSGLFFWGLATLWKYYRETTLPPKAVAIFAAIGLTTVFFIILHMIYGAEVYLYAAHMLPLVTLLLASALLTRRSTLVRILFATLIIVAGVHNISALVEAHNMVSAQNF